MHFSFLYLLFISIFASLFAFFFYHLHYIFCLFVLITYFLTFLVSLFCLSCGKLMDYCKIVLFLLHSFFLSNLVYVSLLWQHFGQLIVSNQNKSNQIKNVNNSNQITSTIFDTFLEVSENKVLTHPASVDSPPTSANQEDHVSMGGFSARKCLQVVEHVEQGDYKDSPF